MRALKLIFTLVWQLGWAIGAGLLLSSHWYIAVPMFLVALIPTGYNAYRLRTED